MGYCYSHDGKLACDRCHKTGGVRKVPCAYDQCPEPALCGSCRTPEILKARRERCRKGCKPNRDSQRYYKELCALYLERGERCFVGVRVDADDQGGPAIAKAIFKDSAGTVSTYRMTDDTLRAVYKIDGTGSWQALRPSDFAAAGHIEQLQECATA
jgi:hypothetical protein